MANNHIIIGLGGVGGNVIKVFRQQIVDKYGDIDRVDILENIEFIYIDSKQTEFDDEQWEYQGRDIKLKGISALLMRAGILNEKLEDRSTRPAFLGKDEDWGDLRNDRDLATKAGNQMRRLGRVNLIPNIDEIVSRVKFMQSRLSADKSQASTLIHIVTGLAGGTGSGSIVDITAQLIKAFEEGSIDIKINLYLKLPELSIPQGWGGVYAGRLQGVSFYQLNGYAALKEINSLANGYFFPYDIRTKKQRLRTDKLLQAVYLITERNDGGVTLSDVISPMASLLFLKTITCKSNLTINSNLSLTQILEDYIDANENTTINPASWWQLAAKYIIPGIYKVGVPKVQIRESFAYLLVLQAFNKLLYKNYDAVGVGGYLGNPAIINESKKETNQIITNLRSPLLDEWYLTFDYLVLNEPMLDMERIGLLTKDRDDYSFKIAFKKEYSKQYQLIYQNNIFKGKPITNKEKMKCLQMAINDFFNRDYKALGYEKYYNNMLGNISKISDFIAHRIKDKMLGKEGGEKSRFYPLESYIDILECIADGYKKNLETDFKNKQLEYSKLIDRKQAELKTINQEFINSFGILEISVLDKSKKREKALLNFNEAIEKLWYYTITLKGITFALQLLNGPLKNAILDIKKEIEIEIKKIVNRRDSLNKEYSDEMSKLNDSKGVKGFASITNDEGLKKFQDALVKDRPKFEAVISKLEGLIFKHKDKVLQNIDNLNNKDLPIMKLAYSEVDDLFSDKNFKDLLNEEDKFYNAHVIEVLFNKFERDADNPKLRDLLIDINKKSSPMAKLNTSRKGAIERKKETIVVLPELQGIKEGSEIDSFYKKFKRVLESNIESCKIIEISNVEFKNEITFAQFYYRVLPDMIDSVEKLKKQYDEVSDNHEISFLMHTEDVSHLSDLIPPRSAEDYKNALLPYLLILDTVGGCFILYGDNNYWKISEIVNLKPTLNGNVTPSEHDGDTIDIFLECNDINGFLNVDFDRLDKKNSEGRDKIIPSFINPFIYTAFRKKALSYLKDESISVAITQKLQIFLDDCLAKAKKDSSDPRYCRFKEAYLAVQRIINNL